MRRCTAFVFDDFFDFDRDFDFEGSDLDSRRVFKKLELGSARTCREATNTVVSPCIDIRRERNRWA